MLRLSLNDLLLIDAKMKEAGMRNRSAYIRNMALNGFIIKQDFEAWRAVSYELRKIGTNINQLAHAANDYGIDVIKIDEIKRAREALDRIWERLISTV